MRIGVGGVEFGRRGEEALGLGDIARADRLERLAIAGLRGGQRAELPRVAHLLQFLLHGVGARVGEGRGCLEGTKMRERRERDQRC